jgi:hypothetical protein
LGTKPDRQWSAPYTGGFADAAQAMPGCITMLLMLVKQAQLVMGWVNWLLAHASAHDN